MSQNIMIGTPTTRAFETGHVVSLIKSRGYLWNVVEGQPVDVGRNIIVKRYLNHPDKPEFLLFADSDATWDGDALQRLEAHNKPVVCGVFFRRDIPPVPTIGVVSGKDINNYPLYDFGWTAERIYQRIKGEEEISNEMLLEPKPEDLVEVDGCGMHFTMIRRDVFEKMKEPWFVNYTVGGGEDFAFCKKVKDAGFKIYMDLSVYVGHIAGVGINLGVKQFKMFCENTNEIDFRGQIWKVR